jgi:hypothetical protein
VHSPIELRLIGFFFPQMDDRGRFYERPHIQNRPADLGEGNGALQGRGLVQGSVGDQQHTLILTHHTPRFGAGPKRRYVPRLRSLPPASVDLHQMQAFEPACHECLIQIRFKRRQRRKKK